MSNLVVDREVDMLSEEHIPLHLIVIEGSAGITQDRPDRPTNAGRRLRSCRPAPKLDSATPLTR